MGIQQRTWMYDPHKMSKNIPKVLKDEVKKKGEKLVESSLKPQYIQKPPKIREENYIFDLNCRWVRNFFYFTAKYHCRSKRAIKPFFTWHFARFGYQVNNKFKISYMRHNDEWYDLYFDKSLTESLKLVKKGGHLEP